VDDDPKPRRPTADTAVQPDLGDGTAEAAPRRINVHLVLLSIIAGLLMIYAFYAARIVMMPLVLACMLNLVLTPLVLALARAKIPEPMGAGLVVLFILVLFGFGFATLAEPAAGWLRRLPFIIDQLSERMSFLEVPARHLKDAEEALTQLGKGEAAGPLPPIVAQKETLRDVLFNETSRFLVGALTTVVLLYFMLAMGDRFLRTLVTALPDFHSKKQAVEIAHQLQRDMSHYLLTITVINVGFGATVAGAMLVTGMPNPLLWGAMAAFLNYIPFLGHAVSAIVVAVVALLSFDSFGPALIPPAVFVVLAALEGNMITPMILARRLTLNPVAVVTALLFWGWIWGTIGLLLAVPFLVVMKITCDQIAPLKPVGEFLGS
jgi:predicted PurR-regulated permease PerM